MLPGGEKIMLLTNMLLKDNNGHLERIVYTDNIICYTISLSTNEMPVKKLVSVLQDAIQNGTLHVCLEEKVSPVQFNKLSDKQKEMTDRAYEIVSNVIDRLKDNLFNKELRGKVVKEVAEKFCITIKSVYKYLKRYWQGGMNKLALVPKFANCGAKGQDREVQEKSLGRKRDDRVESFKVTEKVKKWFKNCLDNYFYSHRHLSLIKCYLLMLNEYFNDVLDKVGQYPSFGQFRYYFDKTRDLKKEYCKRKGEKEYKSSNC